MESTWEKMVGALPIKVRGGNGNPPIVDITYDSRQVKPGTVFVAIPGKKVHGDLFIRNAIECGAVAIISENEQPGLSIPWIQVDNPRAVLGMMARRLWEIDFSSICMVGITGTNGKTTTAMLFHSLLEWRFGLENAWMFGTIEYRLGSSAKPAPHTTPESVDLLRYIGTAFVRPMGLVMEVSSHALMLNRVEEYLFDLGVWTNLTQDHLDFHGTMESYYQAKKRLFTEHLKPKGCAAINIDDSYGNRLMQELRLVSDRLVTFGYSREANLRITDVECSWQRTLVRVLYKGAELSFTSPLVGSFNVYNITGLVAGALGLGTDPSAIQASLDGRKTIPGRMERVSVDRPYTVIVDYAHTPDALVKVLTTARNLTRGRIICVFGCGGDRDRSKRPLMARSVALHSDYAVVTSDNPRSEDPGAILKEIVQGIPAGFPHTVIEDRAEAIRHALSIAGVNDCILIAGKGHETYQEIAGVRRHFDDREVVRSIAGISRKEP